MRRIKDELNYGEVKKVQSMLGTEGTYLLVLNR